MKQFKDTASQSNKPDTTMYAAGYHLTPSRLAMQDVKAYVAYCIAAAALAGSIAAALELAQLWPVPLGAFIAVGAAIYGHSLRQDVVAVRRQLWTDAQRQYALWQRELAQGADLDNDGHIGDPQQASRTVRVRHGDAVEDIILDMPARSQTAGPVLVDFGVTAPDLVSFLFEADLRRGLQERNWIGDNVQTYVLPSGQRVSQSMFRAILAGLSSRGMAIKTAGRWELDCDPEVVAEQLRTA